MNGGEITGEDYYWDIITLIHCIVFKVEKRKKEEEVLELLTMQDVIVCLLFNVCSQMFKTDVSYCTSPSLIRQLLLSQR